MCNPKQISHQVSFVVFAFFLVGIVGWSCKKSLGNTCLTCTAKYSNGQVADTQEDLCGDEAQRNFKEEFHHVEDAGGTIECHE